MDVIVVLPQGHIATGKLLQALDGRRAGRGHRRQLRPGARHRPRARRAGRPPRDPGQLGQPVPPRRPADRPRSRSATSSAGRRTSWPSRSATPATSAPTGRASATYAAAGVVATTPRMWGFQAAGAAPLVSASGSSDPETIATAIRIGDPASWTLAIEARDASGGRIGAVTDDEILAAYRDLARIEGVFCEPASAASAWPGVRQGGGRRRGGPRRARRLRADRPRPQGPDHRRARGRRPFIEAEPTVGSVAVALGW